MHTPSFLIALAGLAAGCLSARLAAQDIVYLDLFKRVWYEQNTAGDPVLIPLAEDPFDVSATAYLSSEILNDEFALIFINGMSFRTPGGETRGMDFNPAYGFSFYEGSVSESYLHIHYGAGSYRFTLSRADVGNTDYTVSLGADDYPPAPKVVNFAAAQSVNASQDFTLRWADFTGAGQRAVWVLVFDPATEEVSFDSGPLDHATASAVIPADSLVADKDYLVQIGFTRFSQVSSGTVPEIYTGFEAYNRAPLKTRSGGGPLDPSVLTGSRRLGNGDLELTVACTPGRPLAIHGASALGGNWGVLQTSTPASSPATVVVPRATLGNRQYVRASQE
jgi:hypothetical protein